MFTKETLKDKSILITGGGSGLGLELAKCFASLGANIAICGRRENVLSESQTLLKKYGTEILAVPGDVREYEQMQNVFDQAQSTFGGIDGLVNNAAGNFYAASEELSPNGFKAVVDIVLCGSFHCSQLFAKQAIANKTSGTILNVLTTYTQTGSAFVLPSACAKAGVYAMTTSLAYEWAAYGIRVNAVAPGPFPTEGAWKRLLPDPELEKKYMASHPMGRFGKASELANLAAFLMSDLSLYINGECVVIDGGERLKAGQFNFLTNLMPRDKLKEMFAGIRKR